MTREIAPIDAARKAAAAISGRIIRIDANTAVRFRVIEEAVDLAALREQRIAMEEFLGRPLATETEVVERARVEAEIDRAQARDTIARLRAELGE